MGGLALSGTSLAKFKPRHNSRIAVVMLVFNASEELKIHLSKGREALGAYVG